MLLDLEFMLYYNKSMIFANMRQKALQLLQPSLLVIALVLGAGSAVLLDPSASLVSAACDTRNMSIEAGADCAQGNGQPTELVGDGGIFNRITSILLFIVGAVAVIMLIFGGIRYVVSGGDQNNVTAAKNTILYAIIGIVVALLAYAAVRFVTTALLAGMR